MVQRNRTALGDTGAGHPPLCKGVPMLLAALLGCGDPPDPTDGTDPPPYVTPPTQTCDPELCDTDGDGSIALSYGGTDCDDTDATVHVRGHEICNAIDDDCDALTDDADPSLDLLTATHWWSDADRDSFGGGDPVARCVAPPGDSFAPWIPWFEAA